MLGENNTRFPDPKTQFKKAENLARVRDAIDVAAAAGAEIIIRSLCSC